jgi:hypothetical protein
MVRRYGCRSCSIRLRAGVETFAVFLRPLGFRQLFGIPNRNLANWHFHAADIIGKDVEELWDRMAEAANFEERVALAEAMLLRRTSKVSANSLIMSSAQYLFKHQGAPRVADVARIATLSVRSLNGALPVRWGSLQSGSPRSHDSRWLWTRERKTSMRLG